MPNVVTHGLMALDVYNQYDDSHVKEAIARYPKAYLLGSNGPDILFYYNVFPWQDQKLNLSVADYGHAVHKRNINEFYNVALEKINEMTDPQQQLILISYIAGHLQHWALDSLAHPFVFYRSGKLEGESRYWHYRYESMIDALMVTYVKRKKLTELSSKRFIDVPKEERLVIAEFYQTLLSDVFSINTTAAIIDEAIVSLRKVLTFLYDPHNVLFPVIQQYEKRFGTPWAFSSHVVGSNIEAEYDVLNLKHEVWSNPTNIDETSTQSFVDLYNESIDLGLKTLHLLNDVLCGKEKSFDHLLQGKCYDTGRLEGVPMQYYGSVYNK